MQISPSGGVPGASVEGIDLQKSLSQADARAMHAACADLPRYMRGVQVLADRDYAAMVA